MRIKSSIAAALTLSLTLGLLGLTGHFTADARAILTASDGPHSAATIDPSRVGRLTLVFEAPNPHDDDTGPSHTGVPVGIRRVGGIDLTSDSGWQRIESLSVTEVLGLPPEAFDVARTGISNATGEVSFNGLPLGLYAITPVAGTHKTFAPFVITLPVGEPGKEAWRYDLTAYPKITGRTETPSTAPGAPADATGRTNPEPSLTAGIPAVQGGLTGLAYRVEPGGTDSLASPAGHTAFDSGEPAGMGMPLPGTPGEPQASDDRQQRAAIPPDGGVISPEGAVMWMVILGMVLLAVSLALMKRRADTTA